MESWRILISSFECVLPAGPKGSTLQVFPLCELIHFLFPQLKSVLVGLLSLATKIPLHNPAYQQKYMGKCSIVYFFISQAVPHY